MWLELIGALALFLLGLRLSAFFSGAETGFYRVSLVRLSIDAHSGDRIAQRLLWFARNPSAFVATTLVGNNVANYLTVFAIGIATVAVFHAAAVWTEVVGALLLSPVVFLFGELMPKTLYYRAPMALLRKDSTWFTFFFWAFLVFSFPLIWITKLFERLGHSGKHTLELVLGRKRLVQVLNEGEQQGLLTEMQGRLVQGLFHTTAQQIADSMTPANRVFGLDESASHEAVLDYARRYGLSNVAIKKADTEDEWFGVVRVIDVAVSQKPVSTLIHEIPRFTSTSNKLDALLTLHRSGQPFGVVCDGETVLGTISVRGLVEQLVRPVSAVDSRIPSNN